MWPDEELVPHSGVYYIPDFITRRPPEEDLTEEDLVMVTDVPEGRSSEVEIRRG